MLRPATGTKVHRWIEVEYATYDGIAVLRLERGDKQQSAIAFYRRHGFVAVPCFAPYLQSATSLCMERRRKSADDGRTARTVKNLGASGASQKPNRLVDDPSAGR